MQQKLDLPISACSSIDLPISECSSIDLPISACSSIDRCEDRYCTTASNVKCRSCEDNRVFFKPSADQRECDSKKTKSIKAFRGHFL